jgi:hypothetical protein
MWMYRRVGVSEGRSPSRNSGNPAGRLTWWPVASVADSATCCSMSALGSCLRSLGETSSPSR